MGTTNSQKSFLNKKFILLLLSLGLTGLVMRSLGPAHKLDSRIFYSYADAIFYFEGLSGPQRTNYFYAELLDLWFLINYSWLMFLSLRKFVQNKKFLWPAFIPGTLDLFETSLIIGHLQSGYLGPVYYGLPYLSFLKWITVISILVYLGKMNLWHWAKR